MCDRPLTADDPAMHHGQAFIRGTCVPVSVVLGCLAEGMSIAQVLAEYPTLTLPGIQAALEYAAAAPARRASRCRPPRREVQARRDTALR